MVSAPGRVTYVPVAWLRNPSRAKADKMFVILQLIFRNETAPLISDIPGLDKFQGPVQHSHDFRTADRYKTQTVLCVGSGASAIDISAIVAAQAAKQVKCPNSNTQVVTSDTIFTFLPAK